MKEREINTKFIILSAILIICTIPLIFFLSGNLHGYKLYEKALNKNKPVIKSEKQIYYREVISLLSEVISLNKDNAEYLAQKADFIVEAIREGFGASLALDKKEAENLYEKAANLSPLKFNYHSKLGDFYMGTDDLRAEKEFTKAAMLYPTYYKVYSDLCKYYLSTQKKDLAFKNLFLALQYIKYGPRVQILDDIKSEVLKSNLFYLDEQKRLLRFDFSSPGVEFDFKKNSFSHVNVFVIIRVYMGKTPAKAQLYKDNLPLKYFELEKSTEDSQIYILYLDPSEADACLDQFAIKVIPAYPMEKIEFTIGY